MRTTWNIVITNKCNIAVIEKYKIPKLQDYLLQWVEFQLEIKLVKLYKYGNNDINEDISRLLAVMVRCNYIFF